MFFVCTLHNFEFATNQFHYSFLIILILYLHTKLWHVFVLLCTAMTTRIQNTKVNMMNMKGEGDIGKHLN